MRFVSCLVVSDTSNIQEDVDEVVLCESHISQDSFPSSTEAIENLDIEWLVLSEGSEIHQRRNCRLADLHVFMDADKSKYVWYELIRLLSSHKIYCREFDRRVRFTRWVCNAPEDGQWSICMELVSGGIIRKIAQLDLTPASHCELNLFRMANELYRECCSRNDKMVHIEVERDALGTRIKDLQEERKILDQLLEERDAKTRSIVIGLLNEKKSKIVELQRQLNIQGPQDSEIMNRHVKNPVRGHILPGTRKRQIDSGGHGGSRRRKWPASRKLQIKEEEPKTGLEPKQEEKRDDLKFWGIQKPSIVKPEDDEEPQESLTSSTDSTASHTEENTEEGESIREDRVGNSDGDEDEDENENEDEDADEEETDLES